MIILYFIGSLLWFVGTVIIFSLLDRFKYHEFNGDDAYVCIMSAVIWPIALFLLIIFGIFLSSLSLMDFTHKIITGKK